MKVEVEMLVAIIKKQLDDKQRSAITNGNHCALPILVPDLVVQNQNDKTT